MHPRDQGECWAWCCHHRASQFAWHSQGEERRGVSADKSTYGCCFFFPPVFFLCLLHKVHLCDYRWTVSPIRAVDLSSLVSGFGWTCFSSSFMAWFFMTLCVFRYVLEQTLGSSRNRIPPEFLSMLRYHTFYLHPGWWFLFVWFFFLLNMWLLKVSGGNFGPFGTLVRHPVLQTLQISPSACILCIILCRFLTSNPDLRPFLFQAVTPKCGNVWGGGILVHCVYI